MNLQGVEQPVKRHLMALLAVVPWLPACSMSVAASEMSDGHLARKFRGIGEVTVILDSMSEHRYLRFVTETGRVIASPSRLKKGGAQVLNFSSGSFPIPKTVRVTWKEGDVKNDFPRGWIGGTVVGDYAIEVANRVPQELIDDLRRDAKGQLRIKFRVTDDGVLLGWDIERRPGYDPRSPEVGADPAYVLAGGDFQEARIFNGKVVRKGWYIDQKTGQRVETDF